MNIIENTNAIAQQYTQLVFPSYEANKSYVVTLFYTKGTQRQINFAISIIRDRIAKVLEVGIEQISRSMISKNLATELTEKIIEDVESIHDAASVIQLLK